MTDGESLLSVRNLKKHYPITEGILSKEVGRVRAVDGIDFDVHRGETVGLVGESGCGKSTAASCITLLEEPTEGEIIFNTNGGAHTDAPRGPDGAHPNDATTFTGERRKDFQRKVQMIFQDPSSSLDPRMTIGETVAEPLRIHGITDNEQRREIVKNLLERVGLDAEDYHRFPHEFSGGQKQRISLARALVTNPELIVADEPVSALDVSIQAEILALINEVQEEFGLSILVISHDMGVIREVSDRVAVMYLGEIVEIGPTEELFADPQHPYTEALLSSIPQPDPRQRGEGIELTGDVPSPSNPPSGCRFHTRCHRVIQPEGYDFEQREWRAVMDLRDRLARRAIDVEAARELVVAESDTGAVEEVSAEETAAAIRQELDIPERLSDPSGESVVAEALEAIVQEDFERADDRLASEFETVCEREAPELSETEAGHPAACHLHESGVETDALQQAFSED
ncbi:MAG: ABC transporter ATP-binding protein [Haloarculaceae archaeon]